MRAVSDERIEIGSALLRADVSTRGAELMSLIGCGREYLWQGDPTIWPDRSPILFPLVGRFPGDFVRVRGQDHPMPIHGFARGLLFTLVGRTAYSANFSLRASKESLGYFPWDFGIEVGYAIAEDTLSISFAVSNHGDEPMPFTLGLHPGFRWPLKPGVARDDHYVEFPDDDSLEVEFGREGFRGDSRQTITLRDHRLPLSDSLIAEGALIIPAPRSRRVRYVAGAGGPSIELVFPTLNHFAIWTRPGARFICLEPWNSLPPGRDAGNDLLELPGIQSLGPGEMARHSVSIRAA